MLSVALSEAGIDMGPCNQSGDLVPPDLMYAAVRMAGRYVDRIGEHRWSFTRLLGTKPPAEFEALVREYAAPVLNSSAKHRGWKLPETLLALPWIVQMFPDAAYVYWTRSPQASIGKRHLTDRLGDFGVASAVDFMSVPMCARIESWAYQWQIVEITPKPARWLRLRWEDVITEPDTQTDRLSKFLGIDVPAMAPDPIRVRRDIALRASLLKRIPSDIFASYEDPLITQREMRRVSRTSLRSSTKQA
jgi:hypothetical protein